MPLSTRRHPDRFVERHIGPDEAQIRDMLRTVGAASLEELVDQTVPASIKLGRSLDVAAGRQGDSGESPEGGRPQPERARSGRSEYGLLRELEGIAAKNEIFRSFLGMGYHDTFTPPVILRNILLNPGWYTAYTPYQAEIAQGRLEALLNFQTMVADLTAMEIANASLLDEGTAAAEAMSMLYGVHGQAARGSSAADSAHRFFVSQDCHPQTIAVVRQRAEPIGIEVVVGDHRTHDFGDGKTFAALLQYPATDGAVHDYRAFTEKAHAAGALVAVAADLLALTLLAPPGEWGADVVVGSSQRFGVPMGYGGPHAAFFATKSRYVRNMPGRIIGMSEDAQGRPALRMALQTREQHIRRERATSNICTAQVLLAVMAAMYAVYHGPEGLRAIGARVADLTRVLGAALAKAGFRPVHAHVFDTVRVEAEPKVVDRVLADARAARMNFRRIDERSIGISLDETTQIEDLQAILRAFDPKATVDVSSDAVAEWPEALRRDSAYLQHPVFNSYQSETEMQRYLRALEAKDLSLVHSMIPLGSCTMKLNAAVEMTPVTWPAFSALHPFVPLEQAAGYGQMFRELEATLADITGFAGVSLQPNAGSQGEYAGLLVIRAYHRARGEGHRDVCLIPKSAHGTNPASAVMAGYRVVVVDTDEDGNIDVADLEAKSKEHASKLAALMVTYPSTHGVFEEEIKRICELVHASGGQVYMDGANMNAQVGVTNPGSVGADVCHLNLHKTFCIPHGGGGPGMGPIGVAKHLVKFLPTHPVVKTGGEEGIGPISAAPWGSASILPISWAYIKLMGAEGLTRATQVAILNANYVAKRLEPHYPVLYKGKKGRIAHECILDTRPLKKSAGVEVEDIAKRLMDYGFHAPTISFPVAGTVMIEPTESESKDELDRFVEAMIAIREEIREIEQGKQPKEDNLLKNAPHTADVLLADEWTRPYARSRAAYPLPWVKARKFWPAVSRINQAYGDRNLVCTCPPLESYQKAANG